MLRPVNVMFNPPGASWWKFDALPVVKGSHNPVVGSPFAATLDESSMFQGCCPIDVENVDCPANTVGDIQNHVAYSIDSSSGQ